MIVFSRYMMWLDKRPLATKCVTAAIMVGMGDAICQRFERTKQSSKRHDFLRSRNFMLYGLLANGPTLHLTYTKLLPWVAAGNSMRSLVKKLIITQTLFAFVSITSFYTFLCLLEGKSLNGTKNEIRQKFWQTYMMSFKVWPLLQLINFTIIPPQLQVFWITLCQLGWNVYLSFVKNNTQ